MATGGTLEIKLKCDARQFKREIAAARRALIACPCWWCRGVAALRRFFAPRVEETPEQKQYRNTNYGRHDFSYRPDDQGAGGEGQR